jgi:hypothetical protein
MFLLLNKKRRQLTEVPIVKEKPALAMPISMIDPVAHRRHHVKWSRSQPVAAVQTVAYEGTPTVLRRCVNSIRRLRLDGIDVNHVPVCVYFMFAVDMGINHESTHRHVDCYYDGIAAPATTDHVREAQPATTPAPFSPSTENEASAARPTNRCAKVARSCRVDAVRNRGWDGGSQPRHTISRAQCPHPRATVQVLGTDRRYHSRACVHGLHSKIDARLEPHPKSISCPGHGVRHQSWWILRSAHTSPSRPGELPSTRKASTTTTSTKCLIDRVDGDYQRKYQTVTLQLYVRINSPTPIMLI